MEKPVWSDEKWKNLDSTETLGWFFTQGRTAPAIILSHAYGSNRSELLTLGFELWKSGYHVLLYDMRGHGESPVKWSGLGTYEKDDLLSAISFLREMKTQSGDHLLDGRVGLYGVDLGGYISLAASSQDPMVKAVAVDSVYPSVAGFINYRLKSLVGTDSAWANKIVDSDWTQRLNELTVQVYLLRREESALAVDSVASSSGRKFLFIKSKEPGLLGDMTRSLHDKTKDHKSIVEVEHTRIDRLYEQASADYDARIVAFFREALPAATEKIGPVASAKKR
jgi:pimeloyl-ACP methyl ester carboxylesterase